jgi:hypothetical protein
LIYRLPQALATTQNYGPPPAPAQRFPVRKRPVITKPENHPRLAIVVTQEALGTIVAGPMTGKGSLT